MNQTRAAFVVLSLAMLALAARGMAPAFAQMPPIPSLDEQRSAAPDSLAAYLDANPACREFSNGCQICIRATTENANCSTPGIACQPTGWMCRATEQILHFPGAPKF